MMTKTNKPRVVICAANRVMLPNGSMVVIFGARHFDETMVKQMSIMGIDWRWSSEQGFIDQFGVFMNRKEAREVAEAAGQIKYQCGGDEKQLFSENLY